uniref:Acyl-CoA thioesterase 6 n=1 Tax=Ursus maritimus TaxID=29073 RepID=A0A452TUV4_URSMA
MAGSAKEGHWQKSEGQEESEVKVFTCSPPPSHQGLLSSHHHGYSLLPGSPLTLSLQGPRFCTQPCLFFNLANSFGNSPFMKLPTNYPIGTCHLFLTRTLTELNTGTASDQICDLKKSKTPYDLWCFLGAGPFPGIIDLFGSGGGLCEYRASLLAGHGFAVLALAYFRFEGLPDFLDDMHLEYFEEAVDFMLQHPKVKGPNVGLLGFSKGGDLCLSMASFLKGITATVLINSCVSNTVAPLHYKDMLIPSLGSDPGRCTINESGFLRFVDVWDNPLEEPNHLSIIPLERAQGPFLFLVGMDDHSWKSGFYAQIASERLQAHGKDRPQIIYYSGTGHCIEPPYFPPCRVSVHTVLGQAVLHGGEPQAQSRAQVDAWQQIQTFFQKHLNGKKSVPSSKI